MKSLYLAIIVFGSSILKSQNSFDYSRLINNTYKIQNLILCYDTSVPNLKRPAKNFQLFSLEGYKARYPFFKIGTGKNLSLKEKQYLKNKAISYKESDTVLIHDWLFGDKGLVESLGMGFATISLDTVNKIIKFDRKVLGFHGSEFDEKKKMLPVTRYTFTIKRLTNELFVLSVPDTKYKEQYWLYFFKRIS